MRLYNQTKKALGWSMGGVRYEAEPWGAVELPDDLAQAARQLGVPLDVTPIAPEIRAQVLVADEQASASDKVFRAIRERANAAEAAERAAKEELGRMSVEISKARSDIREANELIESLRDQVKHLKADKEAAEALITETAAQATAAEERAIKAEALATEKPKSKAKS